MLYDNGMNPKKRENFSLKLVTCTFAFYRFMFVDGINNV